MKAGLNVVFVPNEGRRRPISSNRNKGHISLRTDGQHVALIDALDESSSAQQKAFVARKSYDKGRFNGKCFYCKKTGHKETECRMKKADEERGQVARETSDYAFTATSAMGKTEWVVDSGASSHREMISLSIYIAKCKISGIY
ncbi:hypothetical protein PF005_g17139 [Phytophthora fragariae]|uniref:CCHC-type domain-containing protein n=1 Tax=Phytophthora fragariae TaxID=53985 RepID=A0A6A3R150_9STRA|nr:hypothetical protein PF003_g29634 [Phytophthora fragariae]KAE8933147.1 hypothetical protein PF009_g16835 [Phytophthora fragariae]KAE9087570.1 hypothetical protein PF007_g20329 [Phytophthora fragariae]KAE9125592.1 hypothetical protein PF006_g16930 [Phytophthora fragariae]KAE9195793.1 hypothetical protein PF005_g17139 [Phytophthora fragariae]